MVIAQYRTYLLSWDTALDAEQRFREIMQRTTITVAVLCVLVALLPLPERDRTAARPVPPRLARLLLEKPVPAPVIPREEPPPVKAEKPEPVAPEERAIEAPRPAPVDSRNQARERASNAGLLRFADDLAALRDNSALRSITAGATDLGSAAGDAPLAERSLLTSKVGYASGGISTAGLSRNTGGAGLGGRGTTRVAGGIAGSGAGGGDAGGAGAGAGSGDGGGGGQKAARSREEIEMVFDQNKGAIHALYNRALRSNPGLQGKLVLRLTIEASGEVSGCEIVSSELKDDELERRLVQRVRMFRFLAKDVPPVTTTKPIDFFPA
jgi:TonB family protein